MVTKGYEQILKQKPVGKKKEDAVTGNAKDGPNVKSVSLMVSEPPMNCAARKVDNKGCNVRKRK